MKWSIHSWTRPVFIEVVLRVICSWSWPWSTPWSRTTTSILIRVIIGAPWICISSVDGNFGTVQGRWNIILAWPWIIICEILFWSFSYFCIPCVWLYQLIYIVVGSWSRSLCSFFGWCFFRIFPSFTTKTRPIFLKSWAKFIRAWSWVIEVIVWT